MTTAPGSYHHPSPSSAIVAQTLADVGVSADAVDLATSYELCRRLNAAHGRTYYFATRFLPSDRRHHVHALYGFARYADDLVDHLDLAWSPAQRRAALEAWSGQFLEDVRAGHSNDPVCKAVVNTVHELDIATDDLRAFLSSMAMDLTVTRYQTYDDLRAYMHGSAAVIGVMMLPVLGADRRVAREPAMDLGVAFQLTNFLRDIAEDWQRGRIYLPVEDLDRFNVTEWDFHGGHVSDRMRRLLRFEVERTRRLYRRAEAGWHMLPSSTAQCIRIAHHLYGGILDEIERMDYQVFRHRAQVSTLRKTLIAVREVVRVTARPGL